MTIKTNCPTLPRDIAQYINAKRSHQVKPNNSYKTNPYQIKPNKVFKMVQITALDSEVESSEPTHQLSSEEEQSPDFSPNQANK